MSSIRILIADDHAVIRSALALLLDTQPDMLVVGQAVNGSDAIEKVETTSPDVVLMDLTMPGVNGIEATRQIVSAHPQIQVIGLSFHESELMSRSMREAGAAAFISKAAPPAELMTAIRSVRATGVSEETLADNSRDDARTIAEGMSQDQRRQFLALAGPGDDSSLVTVSEESLGAFWSMGLVWSSAGQWELTELGERVLAILLK